jgi:hypothetical protein
MYELWAATTAKIKSAAIAKPEAHHGQVPFTTAPAKAPKPMNIVAEPHSTWPSNFRKYLEPRPMSLSRSALDPGSVVSAAASCSDSKGMTSTAPQLGQATDWPAPTAARSKA